MVSQIDSRATSPAVPCGDNKAQVPSAGHWIWSWSRLFGAWILALLLGGAGLRSQQPEAPQFGWIGLHGGILPVLEAAAPSTGVRVRHLPDDELAAGRADLAPFQAVLVQHLRPDVRTTLGAAIQRARKTNPTLRVLMLSGEPPSLDQDPAHVGLLEKDAELQRYYGTSRENLARLLVYLRIRYGGAAADAAAPVPAPLVSQALGAYHPEHRDLMSAEQFEEWLRQRGGGMGNRPRVAVAVHSIHLEFQQPAVVDALIAALERRGLCAFGVVDTSEGLAALKQKYESLMLALRVDAVVHTCHSADALELRERLDVPHLTSLFFRRQSIEQWRNSTVGLDPSEVVFQIAGQELIGAIEPNIGAGTRLGGGSAEAFLPIDERIEHLASRTESWVHLRRTRNADKRVALVYWDREMDKAGLMRGSATGMHMNAPRSVLALVERLRREGYAISGFPTDEAQLIAELSVRGRQIPADDATALTQLVRAGEPVLLPVARYQKWLEEKVPAAARQQLLDRWGPAPGRIMVRANAAGEPCFVIPRLDFGGLVMLPQPLRGEAHDNAAIHDKKTAPPHHYLATYFWLQEELRASAVIHFGTHGSELALPGKNLGLGDTDWPDVCMGSMPNIYPWIVENLGEAMVAKRRTYAVLVGHIPPPSVAAGLSDDLASLHDDLEKWQSLGEGALAESFRRQISNAVVAQRLDQDLHLQPSADGLLDRAALLQVDDYLHRIAEETTPVRLHTLGERPSTEELIPHIVSCLRAPFLHRLAELSGVPAAEPSHIRPVAERWLQGMLVDGIDAQAAGAKAGLKLTDRLPEALERDLALARLLWDGYGKVGNELDGVVEALAGRFVSPGPGRGPMRNPGVLPTGRNLYSLNPDEVPSRPSWELGKQLADTMLREHRDRHGAWPRKVAFSLSSFATFQDFGVMEAQVLWLLGCEPVWDEKNLVREVRVIPREQLGRPRVDVFLSALSYYRDNLPSRMQLLDRAVRAVAVLDESDNFVAENTRSGRTSLVAKGMAEADADRLAAARIFGYAPGTAAAANYYYLVERSGDWDSRAELMATYLDSVSHVYTEGSWGESARPAFEAAMQGTEIVLRTWFDNTTSPLANKYAWFTGGSLALAVETVTGRKPEYSFVDVRDPDRARTVAAEDALRTDLRVRLFNRQWIEGMQKEGYAGADQVAVMVSNVFGWETVRAGSVGQDVWNEIKQIYLDDSRAMGMRAWFERANPFAEQSIAELLLEASRKGYWQADAKSLADVAHVYLQSRQQHGSGGGIREAGKNKIQAYATAALALGQPKAQDVDAADSAVADSAAAPPRNPAPAKPIREHVRGQRLVAIRSVSPWEWMVGLLAVGVFLLGVVRRPLR